MRKAIIYQTMTGTVEKCANMLKEQIPDADLINIKKDKFNLEDYDMVILGGAYYEGSLSGKIKKLIVKNTNTLLKIPYYIFICCGSEDDYKEILIKNIGKEIVESAKKVECFGSEIVPDRAKGLKKWMLNMMISAYAKDNKPLPHIYEERIASFIK